VEGDEEATTELKNIIELIVNKRLFSGPGCPSNWKFPLGNDGTLADVSFANWCI
jgi:hypothetical protein